MQWTLALHWGKSGGWYIARGHGWRVCCGRLALSFWPADLDDLLDWPVPTYAILVLSSTR